MSEDWLSVSWDHRGCAHRGRCSGNPVVSLVLMSGGLLIIVELVANNMLGTD